MAGAPQGRSLGTVGEELACRFLRHRGLRIVAQNFTCRFGEIDLIAREGRTLVFVEVKCRRSVSAGEPLESITRRKRLQIIRSAQWYLKRHGLSDSLCRFDAVSVKIDAGGEASCEVVVNAFGLEGF